MSAPADIVEDLSMMKPGNPGFWIAVGVVVFLLLVAGAFFFLRYAKKKNLPFLSGEAPPHKTAREKLNGIRHLIEGGLYREFVNEASKILRYYIEDRFEVRAPQRSTEEFLYEAERSDALPAVFREKLAAFLFECDKVKFALAQLQIPDMERLFDVAGAFIDATALALPEEKVKAEATAAQPGAKLAPRSEHSQNAPVLEGESPKPTGPAAREEAV